MSRVLAGHWLHPACEALPELSPERYAELVQSIREHGLEEPIVRHKGVVLDGRHRLRACEEAGVEPRFEEWDGRGGDPVTFIALKQIRRDMTDDQRAMWAAEYVLPNEEKLARERQEAAGEHGAKGGRGKKNPVGESNQRVSPDRSRDRAAATAGVSSTKVGDAKKVRERSAALADEVKAGKLTLPQAARLAAIEEKIEALPEDERPRAAAVLKKFTGQGVPASEIVKLASRLHDSATEDRVRIYSLAESTDPRSQDLALTELANRPAMPHPAIPFLDQAGDALSRALRHVQGPHAEQLRALRATVREVALSLQQEAAA